jgi:hypothetical protein
MVEYRRNNGQIGVKITHACRARLQQYCKEHNLAQWRVVADAVNDYLDLRESEKGCTFEFQNQQEDRARNYRIVD